MRSIAFLGVFALAAPSVARAACPGTGVVACSRVELKVASCKPFRIEDDPWMDKALAERAKADRSREESLRKSYRGVLVEASEQGATLGACGDGRRVLHKTTEDGAPTGWFGAGAGADCGDFRSGDIVTVDAPEPCCTGDAEVPCLFIEKARVTTPPVRPIPGARPAPKPAPKTGGKIVPRLPPKPPAH